MKSPALPCALVAVLAVLAANISSSAAATATPMPNCAKLLPKTLLNTLLGGSLVRSVVDRETQPSTEKLVTTTKTVKDKSSPTGVRITTTTSGKKVVDYTTGTSWCDYGGSAAEIDLIVWAGNTPVHGALSAAGISAEQRTPNANAIYAALSQADPNWCTQMSTPVPQDCTPQAVPGIGDHGVEVGSARGRQIVWQRGGVTFQLSHLVVHGTMSDYDQLRAIAACVAGGACVPGSAAVVGDTP